MDIDEIKRYLKNSSQLRICVFRGLLEDTETIVKSIYIAGVPEKSVVKVEFEPLTMVNQGEGWSWQSSPMILEKNIKLLEVLFENSLENWVNYSARYCELESADYLDTNRYKLDEQYFLKFTNKGEKFLPYGFIWELTP